MARVKREGEERDVDDDSDSTDEDFNPEVQESDVAEEYVLFGIFLVLHYIELLLLIIVIGLIVTHQLLNQNLMVKKVVMVEVKKRKKKRKRIKNLNQLKQL